MMPSVPLSVGNGSASSRVVIDDLPALAYDPMATPSPPGWLESILVPRASGPACPGRNLYWTRVKPLPGGLSDHSGRASAGGTSVAGWTWRVDSLAVYQSSREFVVARRGHTSRWEAGRGLERIILEHRLDQPHGPAGL